MTRLAPGDRAPALTLTSSTGSRVSLEDFHCRTVVPCCYPAAMTPGCTQQAPDFRDNLAAFTDASVIGISPNPPAKLAQFATAENLSFTLFSDPDHRVMEKSGAWGEKEALWENRDRRHPLHVSGLLDQQDQARVLQREGHGSRRKAHPKPRTHLDPTARAHFLQLRDYTFYTRKWRNWFTRCA